MKTAKAQYSEEKKAYDNRTPEEIEAANAAAAAALLVRFASSLVIHCAFVDISIGPFISLKRQMLSLVAPSLLQWLPLPLPIAKSRRVRLPPWTKCRQIVTPLKMTTQMKRNRNPPSPLSMTAIPIAKRKSRSQHRRSGEAPPFSRRTRGTKKAQKHDGQQCLPSRCKVQVQDMTFFFLPSPILPFDIMLVSPILFLYYCRVVSTYAPYSLVFS